MRDFTMEEFRLETEKLQFSQFLQDDSAAIKVLDRIESEYSASISVFMDNTAQYIRNLPDTISKNDRDALSDYMMYNFIFSLHLLDKANNPEDYEDEQTLEENKKPTCQFGKSTLIGQCENESFYEITLNGEKIPLCEFHIKNLMWDILRNISDPDIMAGLSNLPIEVMVKAILMAACEEEQESYRVSIRQGEIQGMPNED